MNRATIYHLLDAIEVGDTGYAVDVLLNQIDESDLVTTPPVCEVCGQRAWPGDLARHIYSAHNPAAWGRRAA